MKNLEIKQENVIKAYNQANDSIKLVFESLFGKEVFQQKCSQNITDRVRTFEDACDVLCLNACKEISHVSKKDEIAYVKLKIIARALNEGWKPNWDDKNEYKYYPYFEVAGSGFRFSRYTYTGTLTDTNAGVRLVFKTETLAEYAGKQFENLYKDFLSNEN